VLIDQFSLLNATNESNSHNRSFVDNHESLEALSLMDISRYEENGRERFGWLCFDSLSVRGRETAKRVTGSRVPFQCASLTHERN